MRKPLAATATAVLLLVLTTGCGHAAGHDTSPAPPAPTPSYVPPLRNPTATETAAFLASLRALATQPGLDQFSPQNHTDDQLIRVARATCLSLASDGPTGGMSTLTTLGWTKPMSYAMLRAVVAPGSFCPQDAVVVNPWLSSAGAA
ncbi:hypothetical protein [Kitasatospora viridis]|uniref:hypothetical protein n=1 Tax=Kitasatospora viridis TaxID=281105 RepID=UPI0011AB1156|nr:hypothetical protein [Kitasatospora viridis]